MRLLVLTPGVFDKGGISRYNRFQIRALREKFGQNSVQVISLLGPDGNSFEEGFPVSWSGSPVLSRISRAHFAIQSVRTALFYRPNIVLTGHINLGPLGWLCARMVNGLLVQNIYGREVWSGFSRARRQALQNADAVISDCGNTADYAVETGLRQNRPEVIWDCVDTVRYTPGKPDRLILEKYGLERQERFRLMFLGRLHESTRYKGSERLLHLLARLPDDFEGVLAGGGDDLDYLQNLAADLGISHRVRFPGRIHEDHMPDVYRSADVFYLVSEVGPGMGEGLPLTPIEAMACGVPVIVGDQDGSREILNGGGGGISISAARNEPIFKYLQDLRNNQVKMQTERKLARHRIESTFSFAEFSEQLALIITDLCRQN